MKRVILGVVFATSVVFATALVAVGAAAGGPANANITTYKAICVGSHDGAEAVRVELSLDASPNSRAGVALHIVEEVRAAPSYTSTKRTSPTSRR